MQSNAPTSEIIDLLLVLLKMKSYVSVALQIEDESDARLLLDLLLVALDHRPLLFNEQVLDAPRRVRRLMFKLATKIPVLPPSLRMSRININRTYAGWGGYADVFMGEYLGATVALKLLRTAKHNDFCREALIWRSLSHESVLPFLGIYEEEQMFLVSPFMKNGTLSQWRNVHRPATADVRKRLLEVAEGLQYIHSEGIVHGDIRGSNILLDGDFHAKIADFGLTRHFDATATQTDTLSPNFAAPELFGWVEDDSEASDLDDSAKIARTPRSDVYAFGSLYYEIHFNVIPFTGQDYIHILRQVTNKKRPEKLDNPALGGEEWKLMKQCWRHEQSRRPAMEDVVEIMLQWDMNPA
ncbi:hypothetical protein M378DRAFT_164503 [Amanita muscaria Koide BX008]|uniref:Protein kinase domain-containing protein n=1 Tax=Amanita muscaria (strain Koide BX008) TaxID=946122 RepID=A0A0C2SJR6_AMAMK|nr:hypothetical protein M378DRAFT_164503 [Amanita muscaria Koide BX008]